MSTIVRSTFTFDPIVEPRHVLTAIALFPPVPGFRPSSEFSIYPGGHTIAVNTELDLPHTPDNVERCRVLWTTPLQRAIVSPARDPGVDTHPSGTPVENSFPSSAGGAVVSAAGKTVTDLLGGVKTVLSSAGGLVTAAPVIVPLLLAAALVIGLVLLRRK